MITIELKDKSVTAPADRDSVRRLLVPVSDLDTDLTPVVQRLWELANTTGAHVKLLGLCNDPSEEPSLRRRLVPFAAMLNSGRVSAEAEVVAGRGWVDAIRSRCREGDLVVCFNDAGRGLLRRPLQQILKSNLNVSLYILSGIFPEEKSVSKWKTQAIAWAGSVAIILGFFAFQARVDLLETNWATALQLISLPVEVWLIIAWNSLFG